MYSKIQYISQGEDANAQLFNINKALDAGCEWIQLRYKNADEKQLLKTAEAVKKLKDRYNFTFIINDFPTVAKKIEADGIHLGLEDMDITEARKIIGAEKIIGGTANTINDVIKRVQEKVDYIGLGPFRFTSTKEKLSPVLGLGGYQGIMQVLHGNKTAIPVYAIGGLTMEDVPALMHAGVYGIAVSGMITHAKDLKKTINNLNNIFYGTINHSRSEI